MLTDKELIDKVLRGDLHSFRLLTDRYKNLVYHVTRRVVSKQEDAEDICQEVFIKVHQHLKTFKFQSKLATWIAQIAYNTSVNYIKKYETAHQPLYPDELGQVHFTTDTPELLADKSDTKVYLNKLIASLPVQYRTVLTLYHLQEFSYQEIETVTGMPEGTVKTHLFRARKMLKSKLEHYLKNIPL
jgi:RNA polymerase sigma factor (sigma-70 family)